MKRVFVCAALSGAALAFLLIPQIDLSVSGLFYASGSGFWLKHRLPIELLHRSIPWLVCGIAVVVAAGALWLLLFERPLWRLDRKALCFLALSTALGPGLVVNTLFKDHWGRARPVQIEAFGGTRHFTPAPLPAHECAENCSFPSGHAALAFSLVAFALLLPAGRARRGSIAAALGFGALVGLGRIAEGAHFLSDVVYAGLIVGGTTAALYRWIVETDGLASPMLRVIYRAAGREMLALLRPVRSVRASPALGLACGTAGVAAAIVVLVGTVDRPLALWLHTEGRGSHALFDAVARLGLAWGWLALFGSAFAVLHWGGELPRLAPFARRLRAASAAPAFLFAAIAAAGLATDLLKVALGRMRPKLLFGSGLYGFTGIAWHPDHWSFPSGHTATIFSLAIALAYLWPRHVLFYLLVAALVAASRVAAGAHFLGDAVGGAWLAVLTTRGVVLLFAAAGIDPHAALHGPPLPDRALPWPCRQARLRRRRGV
jgi:lipid A 4'-phosphatase